MNGPGPIVGQDYDKIVLGWTEGTTGRRALEAAAEEAALRGSLLSIVAIPPMARPSSVGRSERMNVERALIDSIRQIESTYPGLQIDVTHRSGQVDTELEQSLDRAALLVLGSHHSEQSWSIRVGPIAEELIAIALSGDAGRPSTPRQKIDVNGASARQRPQLVSGRSLCRGP